MIDPKTDAADTLLRSLARQAIDLARSGNKAGIIRLRYMARQVYEFLPLAKHPRLPDLSGQDDDVRTTVESAATRPKH